MDYQVDVIPQLSASGWICARWEKKLIFHRFSNYYYDANFSTMLSNHHGRQLQCILTDMETRNQGDVIFIGKKRWCSVVHVLPLRREPVFQLFDWDPV